MKRHLKVQALFVSALLASGCVKDSPITAVEVNGRDEASRSLSHNEVQWLSAWIEDRQDKWGPLLVTPPNGDFYATIRRADGEVGTIAFFSEEGWKGTLTLRTAKRGWVGSFGVNNVNALRQKLEMPK